MISHCKHLRTKTAYTPDANEPEAWRTNQSSTAQYWCLQTMATAGPDNDLVVPERCLAHRACFESVEVPS